MPYICTAFAEHSRLTLLLASQSAAGAVSHPRPQFVRPHGDAWSLNGGWEWKNATADEKPPFGQTLPYTITTPFPPETTASGINGKWITHQFYRLEFEVSKGLA